MCLQMLCKAYNGRIPGLPANACNKSVRNTFQGMCYAFRDHIMAAGR
jgi:hypothetical protein